MQCCGKWRSLAIESFSFMMIKTEGKSCVNENEMPSNNNNKPRHERHWTCLQSAAFNVSICWHFIFIFSSLFACRIHHFRREWVCVYVREPYVRKLLSHQACNEWQTAEWFSFAIKGRIYRSVTNTHTHTPKLIIFPVIPLWLRF